MTVIQPIQAQGCGSDTPECVKSLVSLDGALGLIERTVPALSESEQVPIAEACSCILPEPVDAQGHEVVDFDQRIIPGMLLPCQVQML